jgi:hypothetical protein
MCTRLLLVCVGACVCACMQLHTCVCFGGWVRQCAYVERILLDRADRGHVFIDIQHAALKRQSITHTQRT